MNKKNVLVVANQGTNNRELLDWYENAGEFEMKIAGSDEEAIELAHQHIFDLVLADCTDLSIDVKKLGAVLPILNKDVLVVEYKGESLETINEKITAAFDSRKANRMRRLLVLDSTETDNWHGVPRFSAN
jgi:hypothetical protein